jgi:hypothetical protein
MGDGGAARETCGCGALAGRADENGKPCERKTKSSKQGLISRNLPYGTTAYGGAACGGRAAPMRMRHGARRCPMRGIWGISVCIIL